MFDKENIMKIDYISDALGMYKVEMVALYNKNRITEEDVREAITLEDIEKNTNVIFMTKAQFENVFLAEN